MAIARYPVRRIICVMKCSKSRLISGYRAYTMIALRAVDFHHAQQPVTRRRQDSRDCQSSNFPALPCDLSTGVVRGVREAGHRREKDRAVAAWYAKKLNKTIMQSAFYHGRTLLDPMRKIRRMASERHTMPSNISQASNVKRYGLSTSLRVVVSLLFSCLPKFVSNLWQHTCASFS